MCVYVCVCVCARVTDVIIQREPWLTLPEAFSKLMSTSGLSVQVRWETVTHCTHMRSRAMHHMHSVFHISRQANL